MELSFQLNFPDVTVATVIWRLPSLLWEQAMQQPPIHHWNGFLDLNDSYTIQREIHVQLFSCFSNLPSNHSSYLQSISHFDSASHSPDYNFLSSMQSALNLHTISAFFNVYTYNSISHMLAYKPVAKKVWSVVALMDEEYHITHLLPDNPLAGLVPLPTHPLDFTPGEHLTQECADALDLDPAKWLWPKELELVYWIVCKHKKPFSWDPVKWGQFNKRYFPPVKILTIPHTPWVLQNIPVPPSMWTDAIQIIKDCITSAVYEPSTAAYCSCWFCILKADRKSLCLIHNLQPLNAVTICNSSTPLFVEHLMESFAGYAVYFMLDLAAGFDQWPLTEESRDLTTFNSPLGPHCLTTILMGYTNAVQI